MELQTVDQQPTDVVPCERGVSIGVIAKGTLGRFLPGSVIGMSLPALILQNMGPSGPMSFLETILGQMYFAGPLLWALDLG